MKKESKMMTSLTFEQSVLLISTQIDEGTELHVAGDRVKNDSSRARELIKLLAEEYKALGVFLRSERRNEK